MTRPRVILADDHKIVVEGLRILLEKEFELVATVADGRALVKAASELLPDVIVADISMPRLNGIEAVRQLHKTQPETKIIFLTMHADVSYATRAFEAGASAYVLKHSAASELVTAIWEALEGRTYVTELIDRELLASNGGASARNTDSETQLTPRQREVLQLLAEGNSAKEIAAVLHISRRTAEFHKYRIKQILGLRKSAELVQYAVRHGIVAE